MRSQCRHLLHLYRNLGVNGGIPQPERRRRRRRSTPRERPQERGGGYERGKEAEHTLRREAERATEKGAVGRMSTLERGEREKERERESWWLTLPVRWDTVCLAVTGVQERPGETRRDQERPHVAPRSRVMPLSASQYHSTWQTVQSDHAVRSTAGSAGPNGTRELRAGLIQGTVLHSLSEYLPHASHLQHA